MNQRNLTKANKTVTKYMPKIKIKITKKAKEGGENKEQCQVGLGGAREKARRVLSRTLSGSSLRDPYIWPLV